MERKIGDTFIYKGKQIKVDKDVTNDCEGCVFKVGSKCARKLEDIQNLTGDCNHYSRSDTTNVIFKELKEINKMQEEKEITISIPDGYEIDKEKSSFEKIIFKKKKQVIKTWDDLLGKDVPKKSIFISDNSLLHESYYKGNTFCPYDKNTFIDKRHAKAALAIAQISQLMPYFGGSITDEEWNDINIPKYSLYRSEDKIVKSIKYLSYYFLSFHTVEQRNSFLENNRELVKDYLMI